MTALTDNAIPERGMMRWLRAALADGTVMAVATIVALTPLFLSNNDRAGPRLLAWVFFPVAVLFFCDLTALRRRIWAFGFPVVFAFTGSIVLMAAAVYVGAIDLSDWYNNSNPRELKYQHIYAAQIVFFMTFIAMAVARWPKFLPHLMAMLATVAAISATINIWNYAIEAPLSLESWTAYRLINWLGMPGYTNSTNISITYAILFIACVAIIARPATARLVRTWLSVVALVLLTAVLLTQARSAYVGTVVGLAVTVVAARRVTLRAIAIGAVACALIAGAVAFTLPKVQDVVSARGSSYRPEIWRVYLGRAIERPLLGYGGLNSIHVKLANNYEIDQPHNIVLSGQIRGGVAAMLAMLTLLLGSLYWSARYARLTGAVAPLAMIATLAAISMMDYNLLITPISWPWVTFWLPFAACAGAEIAMRRERAADAAAGTA